MLERRICPQAQAKERRRILQTHFSNDRHSKIFCWKTVTPAGLRFPFQFQPMFYFDMWREFQYVTKTPTEKLFSRALDKELI